MEDLTALAQGYEKVLRLNLETETFEVIKINEKEKVNYTGINQWFIKFANSEKMCLNDKMRFLKFVDLRAIKERLKTENDINLIYQRQINGIYHWRLMTIYKSIHENEAILTIRDLQDQWLSISDQVNRGKYKTVGDLNQVIIDSKLHNKELGLAIFEYKFETPEEAKTIFNYFFEIDNIYEYNENHIIVSYQDMDHSEFMCEISKIYKEFSAYDITIGATWSDKFKDYSGAISELLRHLEINREK